EQILKKVAADSPQSADAQTTLARLYIAAGRLADAEACTRRALKIDPNYAPALVDLARLQFASGNSDEGEKTLGALSALPDKQYRSLHAMYLFDHGKREEAIKLFEKQAAGDPKDREAFTRLISAYFFAKRFPEAERAVDAALKRNPKDVTALLARGRLYLVT